MSYCTLIGGAGFIGSVTGELLRSTGRELLVVDRTPRHASLDPAVTYLQADFSDIDTLRDALSNSREVIHLAYVGYPGYARDDVAMELATNALPSIRLMEYCASLPLEKFLLVSSGGTVYGQADYLPLDENHPARPISPYGITKLAIEGFAGYMHLNRGFPVVIARPGNAYGEAQRANTGLGYIAALISAFMEGRPLAIFGPRGTIRDYIHVDDIASGLLQILDHGVAGEAYNLGTGIGMDNRQLFETVCALGAAAGIAPPAVDVRPQRLGDVDANVLDVSKLRALCGWEPQVGIQQGLERCWNAAMRCRS